MTRGTKGNFRGKAPYTLAELAELLGGSLEGDPSREIRGVSSLREAGPDDISFYADNRFHADLEGTRAAAVVTGEGFRVGMRDLLRVADPQGAFARLIELYHPPKAHPPGIHPSAVIADSARIHPEAAVSALCHVGDGAEIGPRSILLPQTFVGAWSRVGGDVLLHPRVTICDNIRIGERVIIHSGAVIGSDGFGYRRAEERHLKIPQVGTVVIEDDVEIGANTTVDRATVGATRIGRGTKIDNLVQIAHNVEIGEDCIIISQVGISGSCRIGRGVILAGQVGVADHITIGDGARIGAQSGVIGDVPPGETRSGMGPLPHRDWLRAQSSFSKLPEIRQRLKDLERNLQRTEKSKLEGEDNES